MLAFPSIIFNNPSITDHGNKYMSIDHTDIKVLSTAS